MQGSNMQNDMIDGMGIAVTTPSALEEYEQIEVVNGLGGPLYGPANPSGMFNFITKRPTDELLAELELTYESDTVATAHTDLGGRFGKNKMFGFRTNLLVGDGNGYVNHSQLRRQLASVAGDTLSWPLRYRETVEAATPAARAMSWIVVTSRHPPLTQSVALTITANKTG